MSWPLQDFQDIDESTTFEQAVGSSQPSLISLGDSPCSLPGNDFDADFSENLVPSQDVHTFEAFDMFQNNLFPDDQSQFLNLDLIEDDDLLLTAPELAAPDETGTSQFTSERLQLQHEPYLDPQDDTSTIL
ncbi:hypothetical protein FocnCong_v011773 [Fusarium oxysporum f. sp. conglutinans]|nr:hypothetical protein FocnCong_v011773 [Fusarium oxysporum f. sp. conglutinans]